MNTYNDIKNKSAELTKGSDDKQEAAVPERAATGPIGGLTNEPPIIIGNSSMFIDLPPDKDIELDSTRPPDARLPRPFIYVLKGGMSPTIGAIGRIQVLSLLPTNSNPVSWINQDHISGLLNCQLHIWLKQQITEGGMEFEPVNASDLSTPQIVISGNPFSLEVDKELLPRSLTFKPHSPFRYKHPGYDTRKHFRISHWRLLFISGSTTLTILEQHENEDYTLHVSFWHDGDRPT